MLKSVEKPLHSFTIMCYNTIGLVGDEGSGVKLTKQVTNDTETDELN